MRTKNLENKAALDAVENTCGKCHANGSAIPRRPFEPKQNYGETIFDYRTAFENPAVEKIKYSDSSGNLKESKIISDLLYNFSEPEKSLILTIPLAKSAGGTAEGADKKSHPIIFKDKSDKNYAAILSAITAASEVLKEKSPFCDSLNFRPTPGYIKKLKDLKILPSDFPLNGKIGAREADSMYFEWLDKNSVVEAN